MAVPAAPFPSSEYPLSPQQYPAPFMVTPQVAYDPALIPEKASPPETATGTLLLVVAPFPSSP